MKLSTVSVAAFLGLLQLSVADNLRSEIRSRLDADAFATTEFDIDNTMSGEVLDLDEGMAWEDTDPVLLYRRPNSGTIVDLEGNTDPSCGRASSMYVLADADEDLYVLLCGSSCTIKDKVKTPGLAGGAKCLGNTDVSVSLKGMSHELFRAEGQSCVPYTDLEPSSSPQNKAALTACGLANQFIAVPAVWLGKNIKEYVWNRGIKKALDGAKKAAQKVANAAKNVANKIKNATLNIGNKIGSTVKNAASKVGSFFKNTGGKIKNFFG